jgi:phospholipase C
MTIVSPWTIGGFVDSSVADHTSTLRFLEHVTGVSEPNISDWRRRVCSDLLSAFDFHRPGTPPALIEPDPVPAPVARWRPTPPADQALPEQETGRRPARALGYQPTAAARPNGTGLTVTLGNLGSATAAFAVYPYAGELPEPPYLDVDGGTTDTVQAQLPQDRWDLVVQGPNRTWQELAGSVTGAAAAVDVRQRFVARRAALGLMLDNHGNRTVTLLVKPLAYKGDARRVRVSAGRTVELTWPTDKGWYDLQVTAVEDSAFRRRLTGRVETGRTTNTA